MAANEQEVVVPTVVTPPIEELFASGPPDEREHRRRGGRGKGCLILLLVFVLLLGGVAAGGVWAWNEFGDKISDALGWGEPKDFAAGEATGTASIVIKDGDGGAAISQSLYAAGVTKTPTVFYEMLVKTKDKTTFFPGVYTLQSKMTADAALAALQDPANKQEHAVLLREGLTVAQSVPIISESLGLPLEQVQAAVQDPSAYGVSAESLEGWLFPAMYVFDPGATATDVVQRMVTRAVESLDKAGVPVERREEILILASIIQREGKEADFDKVSRVMYNRLQGDNQETFGKLQMDSTAQYGYGEMHDGSVSSSAEALADDNPWNTYVHPGLPIGPIANPGDAAIYAAMHPADGPWLYFVTVNLNTGETIFTNTYTEHLTYVKQWQEWCAANPDSGC